VSPLQSQGTYQPTYPSREITVKKEEAMAHVAEKNIKSCPGGMEGKSGGYSERKKTKSVFERWRPLGADFLIKRGVMPIYTDRITEEKYSVQGIPPKQKGGESSRTKNLRHNKEQCLDCDRSN
jgi:hypothetical protein